MTDKNLEYKNQIKDNLAIGAKGGAIAFVLKISSTALGFLNQIIFARILGAGGFGEVLLALSVLNISVQIARFGLEEAMMRFIPFYVDEKDDARVKGTIYFSLKFSFVISIIIVLILFMFSRFISVNIFHSEGLLKLLPVVAVAIPSGVIRGVIGGILKGYKDAYKALLPEFIISPLFRIIIFLLFLFGNVSPLHAVIAFVSGEIIALLVSIKFLLKKLEDLKPVRQQYENKKVLDFAYAILFTNISALLYTQSDLWILGMFNSTEIVGIYGAASKLVILVYFPMLAFATMLPPLMSSIHASGDRDELKKVVSESTRWILSMALPIIIVLILEGKLILKYFYGEQFTAGYAVLLILAIGQLIKAGMGLVGVLLQMTGGHKAYMKINIFWGITNVILNIILVPRFGMIGAASATTFCLTMIDIVSVFVIYRRLSVLTFARGLKFDILFIAAVSIIFSLFCYTKFYMGYHLLLIAALMVYMWKSIASHDIPWRLLLPKHK